MVTAPAAMFSTAKSAGPKSKRMKPVSTSADPGLDPPATTKKRKARSLGSYWDGVSGWKAVDMSADFLMGAVDGGFAGLEVLENVSVLEPGVLAGMSGEGADQVAASIPSSNSKPSAHTRKLPKSKQKDVAPPDTAAAPTAPAGAPAAETPVTGTADAAEHPLGSGRALQVPTATADATADMVAPLSEAELRRREANRRKKEKQKAKRMRFKKPPASETETVIAGATAAMAAAESASVAVPGKNNASVTGLGGTKASKKAKRQAGHAEAARGASGDAAGGQTGTGATAATPAATAQDPAVAALHAKLASLQAENERLKHSKQASASAATAATAAAAAAATAEERPPPAKRQKKGKVAAGAVSSAAAQVKAANTVSAAGVATAAAAAAAAVDMSAWRGYGLHPLIEQALAVAGFAEPSPIQQQCMMPAIRDRLDIIGAAQTGSGKTLAFGLPIMQLLLAEREAVAAQLAQKHAEEGNSGDVHEMEEDGETGTGVVRRSDRGGRRQAGDVGLRALILAPTRELALQVCAHLQAIGRIAGIRVAAIVGGLAAVKQQRVLAASPPIVVATPGRLWDLMSEGHAHLSDLSKLSFLVLDEADRMVQVGCYQELTNILDAIPQPGKPQQETFDEDFDLSEPQPPTNNPKSKSDTAKHQKQHSKAALAGKAMRTDQRNLVSEADTEEEQLEKSEEEEIEEDGHVAEDEEGGDDSADEASDDALSGEGDEIVQAGSDDDIDDLNGAPPHSGDGQQQRQQLLQPAVKGGLKGLQTFVFSATLTLPLFLKKRLRKGGGGAGGGSATLESLMDKIRFRGKPRVVDLTTDRKLATGLQEAYMECIDADRDAILYYLLARHPGRTLVFVNAVSATRRIAALLKLLGLPTHALHAQQQQRQRLKALDRFKAQEQSVLIATDVAARGLDIKGVQTVIHYQLPASADTYIHRAGRTARVHTSGITLAIVTPGEAPRFKALTNALERPLPPPFPIDLTLMPQVHARVRLAIKIDEIERSSRKEHASDSWVKSNAKAADLDLSSEEDDGELLDKRQTDRAAKDLAGHKARLAELLATPLQPRMSARYFTGGQSAAGAAAVAREAAATSMAGATGAGKGMSKTKTGSALGGARELATAHATAASLHGAAVREGEVDGGSIGITAAGAVTLAVAAAGRVQAGKDAAAAAAAAARAARSAKALRQQRHHVAAAAAGGGGVPSAATAVEGAPVDVPVVVEGAAWLGGKVGSRKRAAARAAEEEAVRERAFLSGNARKKRRAAGGPGAGGGVASGPLKFGRDVAGLSALEALRLKIAALG